MKNYLIILSLLVSVVLSSAHAAEANQPFAYRIWPPTIRVQPQPAYPYEMEKAGITGFVIVEVIINKNGDVSDARVVRSSRKEFEEVALQTAMKWKFHPAMKMGKPVQFCGTQRIEFNLK